MIRPTSNDPRRMLTEQRRELLHQIQNAIRDVREENARSGHQAIDAGETADADPDAELTFALLQMKTQLLRRVDEALQRLGDGSYGRCVECADPIAPSRLRALPFALRCKDCEEIRESTDRRARVSPMRFCSVASFDIDS